MEDVDEKLLPGWSAEYIDASALPRVSPVCEEAGGGCVEELAEAAVGPPVVRDDKASAAVGPGEDPWLVLPTVVFPLPAPPAAGVGATVGATVPLFVLPATAAVLPAAPLLLLFCCCEE